MSEISGKSGCSSPKIRHDRGSPIFRGILVQKERNFPLLSRVVSPPATITIAMQMDSYPYVDFQPLQMESVPSSWPGEYETDTPTQASLASFSQNYPYDYPAHFDSVQNAASFPRTLLGDHFSTEGHSPYNLSTANSPFISGHPSPFLPELPLGSRATPPTSLEPDSDWQLSIPPIFVNMSDLTSSSSSSASSPSFPEHRPDPSLSTHTNVQSDNQDFSPSRSKRKWLHSDLQASPASNSYAASSSDSPRSGSEFSYHDDDDESDADSVYRPSPGPSNPKKRARSTRSTKYFGEEDDSGDEFQFVADGSKKSRGRKVPVAPEFRQDDQADAESHTVLPSIPFGVKKAGAPNKNKRRYVCTYEGCGKCFVRGEHLKRHVKSLHLCEKRAYMTWSFFGVGTNNLLAHQCPHEGCNKSFSRKDNLKQHMGIFH